MLNGKLLFQPFQNLGFGNCNTKHPDYCATLVANSMCNTQKNECFCKHGFVAIQEEEKTVCRTLLTELYCRVDSDCVHVDASVCHPGAGKCVCPSGKVYVPQLHACRQRFEATTDDYCQSCLMQHGTCFLYDFNDRTRNINVSSELKQYPRIGCVCPDPSAVMDLRNSSHVTFGDSGVCGSQMVDIGEECDQVNHVCKAQLARCTSTMQDHGTSFSSRRCACPEFMVAVHQPNLGYHECFMRIPKSRSGIGTRRTGLNPECTECHAVEGVCYDINDDGIGDGCQCPADRSHAANSVPVHTNTHGYMGITKSQSQSSLNSPCKIEHVFSSCTEESLTLCYLPHNTAQLVNLSSQLRDNQCSVYLHSNKGLDRVVHDDACQLTVLTQKLVEFQQWRLSEDHVPLYCIMINFTSRKNSLCGLEMVRQGSCTKETDNQAVTFTGQLHIHANHPSCRRWTIPHIPFMCVAEVPCQKPEFQKAMTRQSTQLSLELRVLNEQNRSIHSAMVGQPIWLELRSLDGGHRIYPNTINYCAAVSMATTGHYLTENHINQLLWKAFWENRCKSNGVLKRFHTTIHLVELDPNIWLPGESSTLPYRSRPWTAFRVTPEEPGVKLLCAVSMCMAQMCSTVANISALCNERISGFNKQREGLHLLTTELHVEQTIQSTGNCRLTSCITVSQLLLGCMIMLFLDLVVFALLIWSYRHKLIWRLTPTSQNHGNNGLVTEMCVNNAHSDDLFSSRLFGQRLLPVNIQKIDKASACEHLQTCEFYSDTHILTSSDSEPSRSLVAELAVISL